MTKVQKASSGRVLSESEIMDICFQPELNVRVEVQSDSREWVFLDTARGCSEATIEEILCNLSLDYPGQSLRVINMTTGRLVDMT